VVVQSFGGLTRLATFRQPRKSVSHDTHGLQKHEKMFNDFVFASPEKSH